MSQIKYKGKTIVVNKDTMTVLSGSFLILLSLILAGVFAFVTIGCDFSRILTIDFWINYLISLTNVYLCFFGVYIIRENRNKKSPKMVINNQKLKNFRVSIIQGNNLQNCENWLKIWNYEQKVTIYRDYLLEAYRKIIAIKPEPVKVTGKKFIDKRATKRYNKLLNKYHKKIDYQNDIKEQIELTNKHFEIINLLKSGKVKEAEEIKKNIEEKDKFNKTRIKWREVYFNHLFNGSLKQSPKTIFYNKSKELFDNIKPMFILGICITMVTTSAVLSANEFNIYTVIAIIMNIAILICYTISAIRIADNIVFEVVYPAELNKLTICELFKEDCVKNGNDWVDIDQRDEAENLSANDNDDENNNVDDEPKENVEQ